MSLRKIRVRFGWIPSRFEVDTPSQRAWDPMSFLFCFVFFCFACCVALLCLFGLLVASLSSRDGDGRCGPRWELGG